MRRYLLVLWAVAGIAKADSIGAAYAGQYAFNAFIAPTGLILLGGLYIDTSHPDTLLIGDYADRPNGAIYSVALTRDPATDRITGLGAATLYASAPDIDGGLTMAPDGDLVFTEYSDDKVGQLKPGSTSPDATVSLSLSASTGGMAFIPPGMSGAGSACLLYTSPSPRD